MNPDIGKKLRLARLINPDDGRSLITAYSHSLIYGTLPGFESIEKMRENIAFLADNVDGIILTSACLKHTADLFYGKNKAAVFIQCDYQNYSRKGSLSYDEGSAAALFNLEEAVISGVDAVMSYLYIGSLEADRERYEIERNSRYVRESRKYGLPLIIEPRFAREKVEPEKKKDLEIMKLYTRIAQELGADILKIIYPGTSEKLEKLTANLDIPIFIAGGENKGYKATLSKAEEVIKAGADGLIFGRSIFQSDNMQSLLSDLHDIVHG